MSCFEESHRLSLVPRSVDWYVRRLSQANPLATPTRTRSSPRSARTKVKYSSSGGSTTSQPGRYPPSITANSTSSIGVQGDAAPTTKPTPVVDGSSNTTPRPPHSPPTTKASNLDTKEEGKAEKPAPIALVSTGVSASDFPPSDTKEGGNVEKPDPVTLVSTGVSASDVPPSADNRGGGPSVSAETVGTATEEDVMSTTRKSSRDSGTQVERGPAVVEASDGGSPATQEGEGVVIPSVATIVAGAESDPQAREASGGSNARANNSEQTAKQSVPSAEPNTPPSIEVAAAAETTTSTTSAAVTADERSNDTTQAQNEREEDDSIVGREGSLDNDATIVEEAGEDVSNVATEVESKSEDGGERDARLGIPDTGTQEVVEKEADGSTLMEPEEHQDANSTNAKESKYQREREEELEQQLEEGRDGDGDSGGSERGSTETERPSSPKVSTTSTAVVAVEKGRERYESLDGEALLGKLLDDSAPSAMFEDDHQKLLQKVMRVRDDEYVSAMTSCRDDSPRLSNLTESTRCVVGVTTLAK